jgi:curved DNA-binding protein CbpA
MSAAQESTAELFNACRTIFGSQVNVSTEFLRYLQPVGVKSAYKKRALETHPDRAKQIGGSPRKLQDEFRTVKQAYELLLSYVENKTRRIVSDPSFTGRRTRGQYQHSRQHKQASCDHGHYQPQQRRHRRSPVDHFYRGPIPRRNLMLGQYLYYTGRISWRMLIEAISWQRTLRPCIGQIAMQSGMLSQRDVVKILTERRIEERFGECAVRIGYITPIEQTTLVSRQSKQQRRIGEYFVNQKLLSEDELASLIDRHRMHNCDARAWPLRMQHQ